MKLIVKKEKGEVIDYADSRNCAIARGLKKRGYTNISVTPTRWVAKTAKGVVMFGEIPECEDDKAMYFCRSEDTKVTFELPKIRVTKKFLKDNQDAWFIDDLSYLYNDN